MDHRQRGFAKLDLFIGLTILALGGLLVLGLSGIEFGAGYDRIGPRFFPYVVGFGLILLGAWFLVAAFVHGAPQQPQPAVAIPTSWIPVIYLAVSLVLARVGEPARTEVAPE